jgi:2-haloacid dehalogenase
VFFGKMLRDAFAMEVSRVYKPFREIAAAALQVMMASAGRTAERNQIESVLEGFAQLPVHEDVETGLKTARSLASG